VTGPFRVGIFGYPLVAVGDTIRAMARLRQDVPEAELWLLGAPGPESTVGRVWVAAADGGGLSDAVHFTGVVGGTELAHEIARCDVCLFHDGGGPSSRKSTLATVLAAARAVVAVDGPNTWPELSSARAVTLVDDRSGALGAALCHLAGNDDERKALGHRGSRFYLEHQSRTVVADRIVGFVSELLDGSSGRRVVP
jgi:glycosyltransferase involved in cell wall biosynthesis